MAVLINLSPGAVKWARGLSTLFLLVFWLGATVAAVLAGGASMQKSQHGATKGYCWSPKQLRVRPGEAHIQKYVRAAYVRPPTGSPTAAAPVPRSKRGAIRRVILPKGVKKIALTFDLCEQPYEVAGYQGSIVDYLRRNNIPATFFMGGKWMMTHRERALQLMSDPLFEVANHTWEHRNLRIMSGSAMLEEIEGAQRAYETLRDDLVARQCIEPRGGRPAHQVAPKRLSLFRFPFGACNARALDAVGEMGLLAVQWDVSSGDPWKGEKPHVMARDVMTHARPGSIVLFHANGRGWHTPKGVPLIVARLKKQGYDFATVSDLLETPGAKWDIKPRCYDNRPGDTNRYDRLSRRLHVRYEKFLARARAGQIGPHRKVKRAPLGPRRRRSAAGKQTGDLFGNLR